MNFVKAFFQDHEIDLIQGTVDVYQHFGFDLIHRNAFCAYDHIGPSSPGWEIERRVETEGRDSTTQTTVRTPKGELTETHRLVWTSEYDAEASPVDYLIKSERDFDLLVEFQPPEQTIDVTPIHEAKRVVGNRGVIAPWIQGAFNHVAYFYRSIDDLLMDAMMNPAFYHRMMQYFFDRNRQVASQYIDAGVDLLSYGANIASGKMVGADFYREFVMPYEKQLIDFIQDRQVHVLHHNCGYASKLYPLYREIGMSVHESLTAPPYGDTVLEQAFEAIGPNVILHGGIDQIQFLMKATPGQVRDNVRQTLERTADRPNFMLGTSDYLREDTPHANVAAIAEAVSELLGGR
jgi:uroporphyrinogen-III decarboxylase